MSSVRAGTRHPTRFTAGRHSRSYADCQRFSRPSPFHPLFADRARNAGTARSSIHRDLRGDGETRTRTGDTTIFSRVLYQLSYLAAARVSLARAAAHACSCGSGSIGCDAFDEYQPSGQISKCRCGPDASPVARPARTAGPASSRLALRDRDRAGHEVHEHVVAAVGRRARRRSGRRRPPGRRSSRPTRRPARRAACPPRRSRPGPGGCGRSRPAPKRASAPPNEYVARDGKTPVADGGGAAGGGGGGLDGQPQPARARAPSAAARDPRASNACSATA